MGQVTVTLNGRTYRLGCGDGEEQRLSQLAEQLGLRIERLAMDFGQPGDERLLLMAALMATDELLEAKARVAELEAQLATGETSPEADLDQAGVTPDAGGALNPAAHEAVAADVPGAAPSQAANHLAPRQLKPVAGQAVAPMAAAERPKTRPGAA